MPCGARDGETDALGLGGAGEVGPAVVVDEDGSVELRLQFEEAVTQRVDRRTDLL